MRDLLPRVSYIGGEGVGGERAIALYYHYLPHNFFRNKPHTAHTALTAPYRPYRPIPPPYPPLDPIRAICAIRAIRALVATRSASMLLWSCASALLRFYGPVLLCCIHENA